MTLNTVPVTWIPETDAWLPMERPTDLAGLLGLARALGYLPPNAQVRHFELHRTGDDLCLVRKSTLCIEYTFRCDLGERADTFTPLPTGWPSAARP